MCLRRKNVLQTQYYIIPYIICPFPRDLLFFHLDSHQRQFLNMYSLFTGSLLLKILDLVTWSNWRWRISIEGNVIEMHKKMEYRYSGTCAIRHLSFPTSCDFRQEFQVPKLFFNILCLKTLSIPQPVTSDIRHCFTVPVLLITLN